MGLFGGIGESKTNTNVVETTVRIPITADQGSIAGQSVVSIGEGGRQINIGRHANVTIQQQSDPEILKELLSQQTDVVSKSNEKFDTLLNSIGDLAESKQTGGESGRDKTILWVIIAGVVGLYLLRR
jgi:hypothetical protein